jgi:hypothetical protein
MEEKDISPQESLDIIKNMINRTQRQFNDDSFYYMMWGWLVFIASITHFTLIQLEIKHAYYVWALMPIGGIVSGLYGMKEKKKEKIKTHLNTSMSYLWGAMVLSMMLIIFMAVRLENNTYPVLILVYGIGTFVSGGILSFKPLIIGGVICFFLSVGSFFVAFQFQLLFIATAMLASYIIPGHLLKAKFRN